MSGASDKNGEDVNEQPPDITGFGDRLAAAMKVMRGEADELAARDDVDDHLQDVIDGLRNHADDIEVFLEAKYYQSGQPTSDPDKMSDEEYEYTFDPMFDLKERWGITIDEAEVFLESVGYFDTDRYHEIAEYFTPTSQDHHR